MRGMWTLPLLVGGCISVNPFWDGPEPNGEEAPTAEDDDASDDDEDDDDDSPGGDDADDDGADDASSVDDGGTSGGSLDTDGTEVGDDDVDSGSDDSASTTDTPDPGPVCTPEQRLCDGECRDIDKDKHYCGEQCVDCTEMFGNNARCEDGVCEPHDNADGGDDSGSSGSDG